MPADLIGTNVLHETPEGGRRFDFQRGPVFANLVLADEINRATPKTQSALLEAMQERSVTVAGTTHLLEPPFFVLATQNPLEMEGTYPLPEAQLDRFFFKLLVKFPTAEEMELILDRTTEAATPHAEPIFDGHRIVELSRLARQIPIADDLRRYGVALVLATHPESHLATEMTKRFVRYGSSPRGAGHHPRRQDPRHPRPPLPRRPRRPAGRCPAGAAAPADPQLRGSGRERAGGRHHRGSALRGRCCGLVASGKWQVASNRRAGAPVGVRQYQGLIAWQRAMDLVIRVYEATDEFPRKEMFGLTNQIRRAAVSIPSNIAEGQGRDTTREFLRYLAIARGSLQELETQILIASRLRYVQEHHRTELLEKIKEVALPAGFLDRFRVPDRIEFTCHLPLATCHHAI